MDHINKIEYKIRDLSTRAVTLFPSQAQVTREIKDVRLKQGANEIVIYGLSPTVDEHSIKVEGTGAATITDIEVESLPNRDLFEDIYPDSDLDKSDDDESDQDDESEPEEDPKLQAIKDELIELRDNLKRAKEVVANADSRLKILDAHGKALDSKENIVIAESLEIYKQERAKAFEDHMEGLAEERKINYSITQATKEQTRLLKLEKKAKAKANKEKAKIQKTKAKEQLKRIKREEERLKEKARILKERQSFWPKYCYSVRIQLDVNIFTPASSRRASFSSDVEMVQRAPSKTMDLEDSPVCDLVLSYITTSAFWSPSYDLQLSTTNNTGSLCFDARLTNSTSETWENCKLTLSTSQTNFTGLADSTPLLRPWRIKLASKSANLTESDILNSREENNHRNTFRDKQWGRPAQKARSEMFGVNAGGSGTHALQDYQMQLMLLEQQNKARVLMARQEQTNPQQAQHQQAALQRQAQQQQAIAMQNTWNPNQMAPQGLFATPRSGGLFGSSANPPPPQAPSGGGLFGSAPQAQQQQQQQMQQQQVQMQTQAAGFGSTAPPPPPPPPAAAAASSSAPVNWDYSNMLTFGGDDATLFPEPEPVLDFQESLIEETGLTTTYDLPGHKTLIPKSTASKQRIARTSFSNVYFLHTIVAKYQPAAHFKAKVKNTSKLHLLKGPVSLTLDGSFMGRTDLPRCSPGDIFSMSLGVDPAIKVIYPKPEVRRATSGMFSKEQSSTYVRSVTVHNTRSTTAGKPVNLLVLDQVPVSEDERLRVDLIKPQGLSLEGPGVACGVPGRESKECLEWGTAKGFLKKSGSVSWEVKLNAGKAVKLALEYSVAIPNGEFAKQC